MCLDHMLGHASGPRAMSSIPGKVIRLALVCALICMILSGDALVVMGRMFGMCTRMHSQSSCTAVLLYSMLVQCAHCWGVGDWSHFLFKDHPSCMYVVGALGSSSCCGVYGVRLYGRNQAIVPGATGQVSPREVSCFFCIGSAPDKGHFHLPSRQSRSFSADVITVTRLPP